MDNGSLKLNLTSSTVDELSKMREKPHIKSVYVPESIKRRTPSKHYVYKVIVDWTNGNHKIIIYRKYSVFFDFVFKLNQLVSELSPALKKNMQLPELPGRVLFGRTEVYQVAEKRRKIVEEFCQKLLELPPDVSQSNLVLSFFKTWPDDTMMRRPTVTSSHVISSPIIQPPSAHEWSSTSLSPAPPLTSAITSSTSSSSLSHVEQEPAPAKENAHSPSPLPAVSPVGEASAMEGVIGHPDEMENLEQYRVLAVYERKDSHQVNLVANQLVYVIEKHDTGWWMVMSEDEQGYAPASYLEPVDGNATEKDVHMEEITDQVYEAMESYFAENDDEITIKVGDKIEIISKSMDGWWMVRCNGRVGYSPAALIRRKLSTHSDEEHIYESEKSIYEGLNIHRPPPRRNTDHFNRGVKSVHYDNYNTSCNASEVKRDSATQDPSNEEPANKSNPLASTKRDSYSPKGQLRKSKNGDNGKHVSYIGTSSVCFIGSTEHVYEAHEGEPIYEFSDLDNESLPANNGDAGCSIYENTEFMRESLKRKSSSPAILQDSPKTKRASSERKNLSRHKSSSGSVLSKKKPKRHTPDDYEDPDGILDEVDRHHADVADAGDEDLHDMYVDPEDLRKGCSPRGSVDGVVPGPCVQGQSKQNGLKRLEIVDKLRDSNLFDDDYIAMDPVYTEPPLEEDLDKQDAIKDHPKSPTKQSPMLARPLPPPPYNATTSEKKSLDRVRSLEDIIASLDSQEISNKLGSPEMKRKKAPPNPPPRVPSTDAQQSSPFSSSSPPAPDPPRSSKPRLAARTKARNHESASTPLLGKPHSSSHPLGRTTSERSTSPSSSPTRDHGRLLPKMYISVASYTSQARECLSFTEGDRCLLIQQSADGWWLVNIGGREGWTPGEYWQEDSACLVLSRSKNIDLSIVTPLVVGTKATLDALLLTTGEFFQSLPSKLSDLAEYGVQQPSDNMTKREAHTPKPPSFAAPKKVPASNSSRSQAMGGNPLTVSMEVVSTRTKMEQSGSECDCRDFNKSADSAFLSPAPATDPYPPTSTSVSSPKSNTMTSPKSKRSLMPKQSSERKPSKPHKPIVPSKPVMLKKSPRTSPSPSSPLTNKKANSSPSPPPPSTGSGKSESGVGTNPNDPNDPSYCNVGSLLNEYEVVDGASNIESSPWYLGKMERGQAEQFLMDHGRQREFLIRERTSKNGFYALSVRYHYSCKHFNIDPSPDGSHYVMGVLTFPSIEHIISHYQQNSLFIFEGQHVTLSQPVKKRLRPSDANRQTSSNN